MVGAELRDGLDKAVAPKGVEDSTQHHGRVLQRGSLRSDGVSDRAW
jgi:hypothetical protein